MPWLIGDTTTLWHTAVKAVLLFLTADTSFLTGFITLTVILLAHRLVSWLRYRAALGRMIDQPVRLLVVDGRLQRKELRRCGLTDADVLAVLRRHGVQRLADVRYLL